MSLYDNRLKKYNIFIFAFNILLFFIMGKGGMTKYIIAMGLIALIYFMMNKMLISREKIYFILPWIFYILIGGLLCIYNDSLNFYSVKQSFFYVAPILLALALSIYFRKNIIRYTDIQFAAIVFVFWFWGVKNFSKIDLMESQYAFIFGLYSLYYFYNRRCTKLLIALIGLYFANKRIAFLSVILIVCLFMFMKVIHVRKLKAALIMAVYTLVSFAMAGYVFIIKSGFLEMILSKFAINSMGRVNIYNLISHLYSLSPGYLGKGIGTVQMYVKELGYSSYQLLHNDILSMYIELGFMGFCFYWGIYWFIFYNLSKKVSNDKLVLIVGLFIYTFFIFTTDNISIYINYFFPFYMIIFSILEKNDSGFRKGRKWEKETA